MTRGASCSRSAAANAVHRRPCASIRSCTAASGRRCCRTSTARRVAATIVPRRLAAVIRAATSGDAFETRTSVASTSAARPESIASAAADEAVRACCLRAPAMNSAAPRSAERCPSVRRARRPERPARFARWRPAPPPRSVFGRRLRDSHVGRMEVERVDRAVPAFRNLCVAGRRDLVETVRTVHDPRSFRSRAAPATARPVRSAPGAARRRADVKRRPGSSRGRAD